MNLNSYWNQAFEPQAYIEQMTQNRERFEENIAGTSLSSDQLTSFSSAPLRFLIITEDFCGDSVQFVPPLIKLAETLDNVELRLLIRPDVQSLADDYTNEHGQQRIPVVIILNDQFDEIGHLIERPARAHQAIIDETLRFARENAHLDGIRRNYDRMPEETRALVKANSEQNRRRNQQLWTSWLLEDLTDILEAGVPELASATSD